MPNELFFFLTDIFGKALIELVTMVEGIFARILTQVIIENSRLLKFFLQEAQN